MKEMNRINNIKRFNELFDKTNEEITYQPTNTPDRNNPPKGDYDEIFYTEEDMRKSFESGQESMNYNDDEEGYSSDITFNEWLIEYNLTK